jgi:hypothetical protein
MEKHKPISCLAISRRELPENRLQIINGPYQRSVMSGATQHSKCAEKQFLPGSNASFIVSQFSTVPVFKMHKKVSLLYNPCSIFFYKPILFLTQKFTEMKKFYTTLKVLHKAESMFKPGFLILECPAFIVKLFLAKAEKEITKNRIFWDDSQAATVEPAVLKVHGYHTKYQEV